MTYNRETYLAEQTATRIAERKPIQEFANHMMYSDIEPYEVVEVKTENKVLIRPMDSQRSPDWKPEIVSGGFSGHCTNNHQQHNAWLIKSNPENGTIAIRWSNKKLGWFDKFGGRYSMHDKAIKKYDFNF